jgi:hypothetical protein
MRFSLLSLAARFFVAARGAAGLGALFLLAGCNQAVVVLCPSAAILADTASETVFRPGAPQDLSGVAYTAAVTDVKTDCTFDRQLGETFSTVDISFRATRAPSPDAARYSLVYFLTVNSGERVLNKKQFTVRFDFAPGATVATADVSPDRTIVNLERGLLPTDYQLLTGFQLTPEQLAYNRTMGRYTP